MDKKDLLDRDRTEERERAYPSQAGRTLGAFASAYIEQANIAKDKQFARTVEALGRPNVLAASRVSLLDGTDMTAALSIPAATMMNLRGNGPTGGKISGSMRVSEVNKAKSSDELNTKWALQAGVGGLWHVDTSLTVDSTHKEERARDTDYSARVEWEVQFGETELPEGVAIIQATLNELVRMGMKANLALANRKIEALEDPDRIEQIEPDKDQTPADLPATPAQAESGDMAKPEPEERGEPDGEEAAEE